MRSAFALTPRSRKRRGDRGPSRSRGAAARRAHPAGLARRGGRRARAALPTGRAEGGHAHGRGRQFTLAPGALHAIRGSPRRGPCPLRPLRHRATPEPRRPGARGGAVGAGRRAPRFTGSTSLDPDETALVESARPPSPTASWPRRCGASSPRTSSRAGARLLAILVLTGGALGRHPRGLRHRRRRRDRATRSRDHRGHPAVRRPIGAQGERTTTT